jgi:hypothetical protein
MYNNHYYLFLYLFEEGIYGTKEAQIWMKITLKTGNTKTKLCNKTV